LLLKKPLVWLRPHEACTGHAEDFPAWVSTWLAGAVGEAPGDVLAFNGKNYRALFPKVSPPKRLDAQLIQRIAHQIEKECRSVAPRAIRKLSQAAAA
jgi:hypothetical protein